MSVDLFFSFSQPHLTLDQHPHMCARLCTSVHVCVCVSLHVSLHMCVCVSDCHSRVVFLLLSISLRSLSLSLRTLCALSWSCTQRRSQLRQRIYLELACTCHVSRLTSLTPPLAHSHVELTVLRFSYWTFRWTSKMEPPFETLNRTALPAQLDSCQQSDSGCVRFSCLLIKLLRFIRRLLMRFKVAFVDSRYQMVAAVLLTH